MKNKINKIAINQDGLTKHYVLYEDYKKMKQSYESKLKVLQKNTKKAYKKYNEIEISGDKYFVLDVRKNEIDICSKNVLSSEDIKKYFKDKSTEEVLEVLEQALALWFAGEGDVDV